MKDMNRIFDVLYYREHNGLCSEFTPLILLLLNFIADHFKPHLRFVVTEAHK